MFFCLSDSQLLLTLEGFLSLVLELNADLRFDYIENVSDLLELPDQPDLTLYRLEFDLYLQFLNININGSSFYVLDLGGYLFVHYVS